MIYPASITEQVDAISFIRQENRARPNRTHLIVLFQAAIQHILEDISYPFDFVEATRKDRPISSYIEPHLAYYLKIGHRANLPLSGLAATISSALFIDHHIPEILKLYIGLLLLQRIAVLRHYSLTCVPPKKVIWLSFIFRAYISDSRRT
ncbi:hypothetical protein N7524_006415 [Penicillium chrysogenum]|nr:hypothetical protein N7524_006415 [Penicillium chrysogenum]